ncbi:MAG: glycosyltransferase [Deltaproteobacteria bacterium]|nr:glycosyltransferase [Deltaproteobacteria bacterium]
MEVSVVIPVFNGAATLADTLRSALEQADPPKEVIVVNDGSNDATSNILAGFDDRIRCVTQRNQGVAAARNRGAEAARGDWIAFLDQDDLWHAHKLKTLRSAVEREPSMTLVYSDFEIIDEQSRVICPSALREWDLDWTRIFMNGHFHALPSTILIRKDVFEEIGGFCTDFKANAHEDVEFNARAAQVAELHFVDEPLVGYRHALHGYIGRHLEASGRPTAATVLRYCDLQVTTSHNDRVRNAQILVDKLSRLHAGEAWLPAAIRQLNHKEARRLEHLGHAHATLGDEGRARNHFLLAWRTIPHLRFLARYLASRVSMGLVRRRRWT